MLVNAVGCQQKKVALFDRDGAVVDLDLGIDAQGATEIALLRRYNDPVILGQLFEVASNDAIDAGVTDMENVRRRRLDDHGAERAHVTPVLVVEILTLPCLRVQPGVRRGDDAVRRRFDGP